MFISVDLPAPFSPTMPVIEPRTIRSETPRLACTGPNHLSIPTSSIAGTCSGGMRRLSPDTPHPDPSPPGGRERAFIDGKRCHQLALTPSPLEGAGGGGG